MIRVEHLTKVFGTDPERALPLLEQGKKKDEIREETGLTVGVDDVSFELNRDEIFVIMGLSGSGKSTLLRCINRLIEPTAGQVFLDTDDGEIDVTAADEEQLREIRKVRMSMVFQRFGLLPHRTVLGNVAYGLEVQGRPAEERRRLAGEMLELVGLGGWGDSPTTELSGGMQQRVGLARALATEAEVLLLDEPFSALDPLIKVNMQNELLRIQDELHRTLLFITHDLDEALRLGTRIAIMEGGRVVQLGTPEEIIVNPRTEYVADFVEHADPTGVMTAKTVALPLPGERFEEVEREGGRVHYIRKGYPQRRYVLDGDGRLADFLVDGERADIVPLEEALGTEKPELRWEDRVITCSPDSTLRDVLQGRTYSMLPQIVTAPDGRVVGAVSERELMRGILEKRAPSDGEAPGETSGASSGGGGAPSPDHTSEAQAVSARENASPPTAVASEGEGSR